MATSDFSQLSTYLNLQDMSGSAGETLPTSINGVIYYSSGSMHMRDDLAVNGKITNVTDPASDQDAATKAYVDAQLTAQDLDFQGDSGGALSIDLDSEVLDIAGGTGLETAGSGNTLTVSISNGGVDTTQLAADAVDGTKIADNAVNSEHIALGALDQEHYATGSIDSNHLAGSVANVKLANSSVTVTAGDGLSGGGSVALGATVSLAVGVDDSSIETNSDVLRIKASGVTNAMLAGSIANGKLANSAITVGGTATSLGGTITGAHVAAALNSDLGGNFTIGNQSDNSATFTGGVIVGGDLTVNGTTTTVNSTTINVSQSFTFEGPADAHETTLHAGTPAADSTLFLPALSAGSYYMPALADAATDASAAVLAAEFALLDGDSTVGTTALAAGDGFLHNDNGTMRQTSVNKIADLFAGDALVASSGVMAVNVDDSSIEVSSDAIRVKASGVTNAMLAGSIANAKLANDSVIVGSTEIDLGATSASLAGLTGLDFTAANASVAASIGANTLQIGGSTSTIAVPGQMGVGGGYGATGISFATSGSISANGDLTVDGKVNLGHATGYAGGGVTIQNGGMISAKGAMVLGASGGSAGADFTAHGATSGKNLFWDASEDTAIVNGSLTVNGVSTLEGNVALDGQLTLESDHDVKARSFITYSDRELKTNIQPMNDALSKVMKLEAVSYDLKAGKKNEIGFIAQDVAKVVPEICALDNKGVGRGIDYSRMSTLLVGALKAQQTQIEDLKKVIAKLQK